MYRTGFGDCFLLTLQSGRRQFNALIDFGVHTGGNIDTLGKIMEDIEVETSHRLDLIIASHAHQDHISGFGRFQSRFANFRIDEVWLPWTEDPRNRRANLLRQKQAILFEKLHSEIQFMLRRRGARPELRTALNVLLNLRGNEKALRALATAFGTN
ncbi:MAG TPA: MBL fold metallo-hydrolase, partial [Candidatus Angelobacter sp.]